jgi:hypothetical protein
MALAVLGAESLEGSGFEGETPEAGLGKEAEGEGQLR